MSVTTTSADETGEISVSYTRYLPARAALSHQIVAARRCRLTAAGTTLLG